MLQQLALFLAPYFSIARTGTYALLQNLEAFGVSSAWFGFYIDIKGIYINRVSVIYMLFIIFTAILNTISTLPISKKLTLVFLLIWLTPGFLSVADIYLIKSDIPEVYHVGSGSLGTIWGVIVNSLLVVIFGWSITNIIIHISKSDRIIKPLFEHVWYIMGLSAVIFYVVDADIKEKNNNYIEAKHFIDNSFSLITQQSKIINSKCMNLNMHDIHPTLCNSIYDIYSYSLTYLTKNDIDREYSEKPTINEILKHSNVNLESLKNEINDLNDGCRKSKINDLCIPINSEFMQYDSDLATGNRTFSDLYGFPLYILLKGIEHEWKPYTRYLEKNNGYEKIKNIRWIIYIFVSILVGVKLAISSRDLLLVKYKPTFRVYMKSLFCIFIGLIVFLKKTSSKCYSYASYRSVKLIERIKEFQSSIRNKNKAEEE